ncbi:MAG: enoyl-CoA hydratase-related protein [Pseudomonadota bacterium]|nr:enoyl-CoA hydratase-related protein [Pseudomonadota bacterium]
MTDPVILTSEARGVVTLTLNRPGAGNALDRWMLRALRNALRDASDDPSTRLLILTGAGKIFCSGADLAEIERTRRESRDINRAAADLFATVLRDIHAFPVPTVARVNGHAFGGGAGLLACCDLALAEVDTRLAFTETRLGLAPALVAPWIAGAIGPRRARQLFLTGSPVEARQAESWGLITTCVAKGELDTALASLAHEILQCAPDALRRTKQALRQLQAPDPATSRELIETHLEARTGEEAGEGIRAFFARSRPSWQRKDTHDEHNDT